MGSRRTRGLLIRVIALVAVTGLLGGVLVAVFFNLQFQPQRTYRAMFADASGLATGNDVRAAGVKVGRVDGITLEPDNQVMVSFTIADSVPMTGNTTLASANLIANLKNLQPVAAKLADSGKSLIGALNVLPTYPFPIASVQKGEKGDYGNLFLTVDLNVSDLEKLWLSGSPASGLAGDKPSTKKNNPLTAPLKIPALTRNGSGSGSAGGTSPGGSGGSGSGGSGGSGGILGGLTGGGG